MHAIKKQQGISLIEVLVSMVIFSVGILGMITLQARVLQQNFDQHQRDVAIWTAQAIIDRVGLNKSEAALTAYESSIASSTLCDAPPAVMCAETNGSAATICTASEMATFDAWDVLCTADQGAVDVLIDFNVSFDCSSSAAATAGPPPTAATNCALGDTITLQFLWRSHTARADSRFSTSTITDATTVLTSGADIDGYVQVFIP